MSVQIDPTAEVFTLINTFYTTRERQAAIVSSLREYTLTHARALPGFVGASVHASLDGLRVVNYVQWRTAAALEAMLASHAARSHLAEVASLADRIDPVPYRVVFVGTM